MGSTRRIKVTPTGLGFRFLVLYVALIGVYFVTAYANLFFLLMCFLGALFVVGAAATALNLRGVSASVGHPRPAPVGEPVLVPVTVDKAPARGASVVKVDLRVGGRRFSGLAVARVAAGWRWDCAVTGLLRGVYRIDEAWLTSTAPIGLFRARRRLPIETLADAPYLVAHPVPLDPGRALAAESETGELPGALADRAQPASLREYVHGDDLRRVHWKASARGAGLMVKEWDEGADRAIEVVLDGRCPAGPSPSGTGEAAQQRFERALSRLAGLGVQAFKDKRLLTVITQDARRTFGEGFGGQDELMAWLAARQPLPATAGAPPSASPLAIRLNSP